MLTAELSKEYVQKHHPQEYNKIKEKLDKKGVDINEGSFYYSYVLALSNDLIKEDPQTKKDFIDHYKKKMGISLVFKDGKRTLDELIYRGEDDNFFPQYFIDWAIESYKEKQKEQLFKENQFSNYDAILKENGIKEGFNPPQKEEPMGVMNGVELIEKMLFQQPKPKPRYPTKEELINAFPKIYKHYKYEKSDGNNLVIFDPASPDADEWGFVIKNVLLATKRVNSNGTVHTLYPRITLKDGFFYALIYDQVCFMGFHRHYEKALNAQPGSYFKGFKNSKQYRYTQDEIDNMIKNKIFHLGNIIL